MPSHVKIFFWLGMAAVLYSVMSTAWFLAFPSAQTVAALARLPPDFRAITAHSILWNTLVVTAIWAVIHSGLLWLAAFGRKNWARWGYALVFAFHKIAPWAVALAYWGHSRKFPDTPLREWTDPRVLLFNAVILAAIAFAFTGNARDWFKPAAREVVAA